MAKIILPNVNTGFNPATMNQNFQDIAEELSNDVLYRNNPDGEPNQMLNLLDMNGNRIINLPEPIADHEPMRRGDAELIVTEFAQPVIDAANLATLAAEAATEAAEDATAAAITATDTAQDAVDTATAALVVANAAQDDADDALALAGGVSASVATAQSTANTALANAATADGKAVAAQNTATSATTNINTFKTDVAASSGSGLVGFIQAGTGAVLQTVQKKLRERVSVRDFGAVGDGVQDDTLAFQKSADYFGSGGVLATANGGVLYIPKGLYKISSQILIQQTGVRIEGESQESTKIVVSTNLGTAAVFKFDQIRTDYSMVGVGVQNLRIDMTGKTGHGIWMLKPYDGVTLQNLYIDNVADSFNGFRIDSDPGVVDIASQTVLMENCCAIHQSASATAPLFYLRNLQEASLVGCKGFGTYEVNGKANCYPIELVDCRGITLLGCSSAFASKHGIKITVETRPITGISIINHTFETITGCIRADGLAGIGEINGLRVINPRAEGGVSHPDGTYDLNLVWLSMLETAVHSVNIDSACVSNVIQTFDASAITNLGTSSTIIGMSSQADTLYKIDAGGLRVRNGINRHIETSNLATQLFSSGSLTLQADYPFGPSQAGMILSVNRSGTVTMSRVEVGVADSGGSGYRMLRVAN